MTGITQLDRVETRMTPEQLDAHEAMLDLELAAARTWRMMKRAVEAANKLDPHCRENALGQMEATMDEHKWSVR